MLIAARNAMMAGEQLPYGAKRVEYLEIGTTPCRVVTGNTLPLSMNFSLTLEYEELRANDYNAAISRYYSGGDGFVMGPREGHPCVWTNANYSISSISSVGHHTMRFYGTGTALYLESQRVTIQVGEGWWRKGAGSITFFCRSDNWAEPSPVGFRFYSSRFIFDNNVVRDFIPVRFTNEQNQTEGAMYDRVSGELFRNAGTGAFVIGPDIAGGGYKRKCVRRSYRRSARSSARFCAWFTPHLWKEVA